jgi:glycosyltransferase involved in cell wall biosynthesis
MHIPLVYTHTLLGDLSARPWKRCLQRLYWRVPFQLMDCVVVSSGVMRDALRHLGVTTRIEVIPNGLDLNRFRPVASLTQRSALRQQLGFDPTAELILFVGPIVSRKGIEELVEAWSLLGPTRPRAKLILVGPRYDQNVPGLSHAAFQAKVEAAISRSGAGDRVIFTDAVKNPETYFQIADVFVFPSRREGMPNVVLEAFGCGLASILMPFIGLPDEFGRPGEQYVLVERTPEALATAINVLLDDPAQRCRLGHQARKWVEGQMDIEKSIDDYATLYHELADRSQQGKPGKPCLE